MMERYITLAMLGGSAMVHGGLLQRELSSLIFPENQFIVGKARIPLKNNGINTLSSLTLKKNQKYHLIFKNIEFQKNNYFNETNESIKIKFSFRDNSLFMSKNFEAFQKSLKYNKRKNLLNLNC